MAEPARIHTSEAEEVVAPKPALQLVSEAVDAAGEIAVEPNLGRSAVIGYVVGFFVVAVGITSAGTLAGWGFGNSLGLGTFVGVWGGGGFGFMMGGTIPLARHLDSQSAHSIHHGQGDTHGTAAR